jgi:adenylate cyclase
MRRLLAIVWMSASLPASFGQNVDSLLHYLDSTQLDTVQADLNYRIGSRYGSSAQGVPYLQRGIAICRELARSAEPIVRAYAQREITSFLIALAESSKNMEDHVGAVNLYREAASLLQQRGDSAGTVDIENSLGLLFQKAGDRKGAMQHYRSALAMALSIHHPWWPTSLRARMATLFVEIGELDSAEFYLAESLKDRSSPLHYRYRFMALLREAQGRIPEAITWLDSSLTDSRNQNMAIVAGASYLQLTRLLEKNGRPTEALSVLDSCLAYFEHGDRIYYCQCLQMHGRTALLLGRQALAEAELTRALAIAGEVGQLRTQLLATGALRDLYRHSGRYERALRMADQWQVLTDSMNTMDAKSELIAMNFRDVMRTDSLTNVSERERQRLESEARLSKERTRRNIFLFSGIVLLVFGLVVYRQRNRIKKEHDRSEELLLNILPEEVAEELKSKGHADAKHFENVTILFTDFKGFTEASEKLSPQELVEELNTCFKAFDQIITARGIEKIKTIGDAYMCAGGLPVPSSSTPAGVVLAALEMQAFMVTRKKERDALGKPAFEMRAGIHTGPVVAGIVGVKKFQYDIWGDTVNTASRMESSGEVGQVNISEATYALVKDVVADDVASNHRVDPNGGVIDRRAFTFTPRGKVQAKGKGEMEMYFVRQVLQEPEMERIDPPSP